MFLSIESDDRSSLTWCPLGIARLKADGFLTESQLLTEKGFEAAKS